MTDTTPPAPSATPDTRPFAKFLKKFDGKSLEEILAMIPNKLPEKLYRDSPVFDDYLLRRERSYADEFFYEKPMRAYDFEMVNKLFLRETVVAHDRITGRHPEQRDDETFLGNYYRGDTSKCGWRTKRVGVYAYCKDGTRSTSDSRPVFVQRSELEAAGIQLVNGELPDYSAGAPY